MATAWRVLEESGEPEAPPVPVAAGGANGADPGRRWLGFGVAIAVVLVVAATVIATAGNDGSLVVDAAAQAGAIAGAPTSRPVASSGPQVTASLRTLPGSGAAVGSGDPGDLVIEVNGAVRRPGLYHLSAGSRVGDAITAAGGYSGRVDAIAAQSLNLAARITDGQQIHAPSRDERPVPVSTPAGTGGNAGGAAAVDSAGPVNLNTATEAELEALPSIGPATAAKVIAARQEKRFRSVQELRDRKIVGAATLAKIKDLVTAR